MEVRMGGVREVGRTGKKNGVKEGGESFFSVRRSKWEEGDKWQEEREAFHPSNPSSFPSEKKSQDTTQL